MKTITWLILISLAATAVVRAQGNGRSDPSGGTVARNADNDWSALSALVAPGPGSRPGADQRFRAGVTAAVAQTADRHQQAAQAARAFHTAYPTDPRAAQARKLEVTSLLRGVLPSDADRGQSAFAPADAYRADASHSVQDRLDVAALAEAQRYLLKTNGNPLGENAPEQERIAGALRAEFGDSPEVAAHHLRVVDSVDPAMGFRLANAVSQMPATPAVLRQAQTEIERHALLGQPLDITLHGSAGRRIDLAETGKVTVLYVWSERHGPSQWSALARAKPAAPAGTRWVYLALDTTPGEAEAALARAPIPGESSVEPGGPKSAALKALKIRRVPFVYVFDTRGLLSGYGSPEILPTLLQAAQP